MGWLLANNMVNLPIIQGGMGVGISLAGLASAVAREGGVGCISAVGLGWDEENAKAGSLAEHKLALQKEINTAKRMSPRGVIGVNFLMAMANVEELLVAATEACADALFVGAGLLLNIPAEVLARSKRPALVPIVSSGRAARILRDTWKKKYNIFPDAFVVEGPLAGGHLGFKREEIEKPEVCLENILKEVLIIANETDQKIPVIAAGGIFSAKDIEAQLRNGATAVQLGTRFVATHECDASLKFKEAYIHTKPEDIEIINSPVGLPGRAIHSAFLSALSAIVRPKISCRYRCLRSCNPLTVPYCIAKALLAAKKGDFNNGFAFCGANAHRISTIVSVKNLLRELLPQT